MKSLVQLAPSGRAACRGASVGLEDPVIKQQESACVGTDSLGLSVRRRVSGFASHDAPARTVVSARAKGSALAPLDGRVKFAQNVVQRESLDQTVLTSVSATTGANVTLKLDSASVPKVSLVTGVMRSVLWARTVRTVKVCVTVLTALAATTLMEAAYVSRASAVHSAETGCVLTANTACTVSAHVSVKTNTHSAATQ